VLAPHLTIDLAVENKCHRRGSNASEGVGQQGTKVGDAMGFQIILQHIAFGRFVQPTPLRRAAGNRRELGGVELSCTPDFFGGA
jgi:hypothetical protein